uniref:uncharacterized protein K02A2.6-like n=1 Tax=Euleptes europaea TaxID=460621 RepID=UPI0025403C83|nr:uncharacterized protein K02A2.6-like [Euleptes europaea]
MIITDHKPLLGLFAPHLQTLQILSPWVLRWLMFLNAYSFDLVHWPGRSIGHADGLSRLPIVADDPDPAPAHDTLLLEALPEPPLQSSDIAAQSSRDRTIAQVLNWVWRGCLLWGNRVVVPAKLHHKVMEALHMCHPGMVCMKAVAHSYVWWPGIDAAIEEWVHRCNLCQESQPEMPQAPVHHWKSTHTPWSRVHIDFAGPFQGKVFLIVVDSYFKWLEVLTVNSMMSRVVVKLLRRVFTTHGLPDTLISDNGAQFASAEFREFLQANLIRHVTSAPFHPATNGQAERMVRSTKEALGCLIHGDWDMRLADYLLFQRITPCTTMGKSPVELLMGRRLKSLLDRIHPDLTSERHPVRVDTTAPRVVAMGDTVYARNYGPGPAWVPTTVRDVTGPVSYRVVIPEGRVLRRHIGQLWRQLPDWPIFDGVLAAREREWVRERPSRGLGKSRLPGRGA